MKNSVILRIFENDTGEKHVVFVESSRVSLFWESTELIFIIFVNIYLF